MDTNPEDLDCIRCGACCFGGDPRYVAVTGEDYARLGDDAERLVRWIGNRAFIKLVGGGASAAVESRCAALEVSERGYWCEVYEFRPSTCRDLARGSAACLAERERKLERR